MCLCIIFNVDALVCKNTILFSNKSCQPHLSVNFIGNCGEAEIFLNQVLQRHIVNSQIPKKNEKGSPHTK